jgi:hypothetical protein
MKLYTTITTIQPPTDCIQSLVKHLTEIDGVLVVTGDQKGPDAYDLPNTHFFLLRGTKIITIQNRERTTNRALCA